MSQIAMRCSRCGSEDYQIISAKTGEVACTFCRNKWFVPDLAQKTETEKFLEEQAKQPRVTYDNSTETDQKLMDMVTGLAGGNGPLGSFGKIARTVIIIAVVVLLLIVACIVINIIGGLKGIMG